MLMYSRFYSGPLQPLPPSEHCAFFALLNALVCFNTCLRSIIFRVMNLKNRVMLLANMDGKLTTALDIDK